MAIHSLKLTNFRNFQSTEFKPIAHGLNIITGANGSGKTSLLEAIHFLSMGRSFRTTQSACLIHHQSNRFSLFSQFVTEAQRKIPVGIERSQRGIERIRVDEKDTNSLAELAYLLPVRLINSQSHHFFESGPSFRRKLLDWGLFYHHENYLTIWQNYERALKQRNSALRDHKSRRELEVWTAEVDKYGMLLHQFRLSYANDLMEIIKQVIPMLLQIEIPMMRYLSGWGEDHDLYTSLMERIDEQMRQGFTLVGPHRADLAIILNEVEVKHILSRGQQKLLICAIILAQGLMLAKSTNKTPIYLVDDLPAELDEISRQKLIQLLLQQKSQVFITAIEAEAIWDDLKDLSPVSMKMFHVEHDRIGAEMTGVVE